MLRWRFEQAYPGLYRDGEIGWFRFWDGLRCLRANEAQFRLNIYMACAAAFVGGDDVKQWFREQLDLAAGIEE